MKSAIDAADVREDGRFSTYQKLLIFGTALTIVLDGVDNQLLPNAIPSMMAEWRLPRAAFATASAAGPFGMMIGGVLGGILGDRAGRRTALLASVITFAVLTLAVAFVQTMGVLTMVRFLAGIGLGGAMPNAAALAAEYAPRRYRSLAISVTIVCIPLGGALAGLMAGLLVPVWGWRLLFAAGGLIPILVALVLLRVLPESPEFIDASRASSTTRGSIADLFSPEYRRDTCGLMGAFCCCLLTIYVGFLWIPAMLTGVGFSQPAASYALGLFNFGGVAGALGGAILMQRLGSRAALLGMSALAVAAALVMAAMTLDAGAPFAAMTMFAATGALFNAVQVAMYALAAHVYPTAIRSTGVGTTVAVGRIGNVLASYVGSWALNAGGAPRYFSTWAAAMAVVFLSLAFVRRHMPKSS